MGTVINRVMGTSDESKESSRKKTDWMIDQESITQYPDEGFLESIYRSDEPDTTGGNDQGLPGSERADEHQPEGGSIRSRGHFLSPETGKHIDREGNAGGAAGRGKRLVWQGKDHGHELQRNGKHGFDEFDRSDRMSEYIESMDPNNLVNVVKELAARVNALERKEVNVNSIEEISPDLGIMLAGEFRAGEGYPGAGFSGVRVGYPSFDYNGYRWHLVGVYKDRLMFGLSAEDGSALFLGGKGTIGDNGIEIDGLMNAITQKGIGGWLGMEEAIRYGRLGMFTPEGSKVPVWGLELTDDISGEPVLDNGLFSTGDLTGWSQTGSNFSVMSDKLPDYIDGYVLELAEKTTEDEETLTGVSQDVVEGEKYSFSLWTRENVVITDVPVSENLCLDESNPDTAQGSLPNFKINGWLEAGYYLGQLEQRTLLRFDRNATTDITVVDEAGILYYIRKNGLTLGVILLEYPLPADQLGLAERMLE